MGFFDKIKKGLEKTRNAISTKVDAVMKNFRAVDEDLLDELDRWKDRRDNPASFPNPTAPAPASPQPAMQYKPKF